VTIARRRRRPLIVQVLGTLLAAVALTGASLTPAAAAPRSGVDVRPDACFPIAHRAGPTAGIDENTADAIRRNGRLGAWAEIDVRRLRYGGMVLMHDKTLDRTTNGTGRVEDRHLVYIRSLRTEPNGHRVPTLKEAMLAASQAGTTLYIELKEFSQYWSADDLVAIRRLVLAHDMRGQVYLGGTRAALNALEETTPGLRTFWRTKNNDVPTVEEAAKRSVEVVQTLPARLGSALAVEELKDAGYVVAMQSANSPVRWLLANAMGIGIIQVNAPSRYRAWCAERD
jgi:glycerophosphoryl diester phosphodiesterase